MRTEWRVAWRRDDGGVLRSKRVRNEAEGQKLARFLVGDFPDPNALNCCSGYQCGCGGLTVREAWEAYRESHIRDHYDPETGAHTEVELADITWGPVVQSRAVEPWS